MLVLVISAGVVHGGGRWSGIDPEVLVDGEKINVYIEWPQGQSCNIDGDIDVDFWYPKGADAQLVFESESYDEFPCLGSGNSSLIEDGFITVLTKTNLKEGTESDPNQGGIMVSAKVNTAETMPVTIKVYRNTELVDGKPVGDPIQVCNGFSDDFVFCEPLQLD